MNSNFFPNNRRSLNNSYGVSCMRSARNNFSDNFVDFHHDLHNSTMRSKPTQPFQNRYSSSTSDLSSSILSTSSEKPSFSSLFNSSNSVNQSFTSTKSQEFPTANTENIHHDDDGVLLQISNLDQWYDEASLKHYLMNQLKPITPILSLNIETPSIAKVRVPSTQFAKQVISHLHRKKMGHKRIFVSFLKDKTVAECSALRNKVIGLLRDVPGHQLPMSKFRELFQSRFKSSISILDLYRMPSVCRIEVNHHDEKIITLEPGVTTEEPDMVLKTDQHSAPYCLFHYKADKNKGWAEIEIEPLPNVFMTVAQVQAMICPLLRAHQGDIPVASLLYCLEAELDMTVQVNDRGVSLEHLVSCIPNIIIRPNDYGIKIIAWRDENSFSENSMSSKFPFKGNINSSCGDTADNISKEVIELIRMCPKATMQFSKFIPTYHNHFGKQCRVADYGCTKLIEMFEAMSSIVQVLGEGESRQITLTHRTQIRRFTNDIFKILRNQASKSIYLSKLPQAFIATHNRIFDVTDYGVCNIEDLLNGLRNNSFISVTSVREEVDDYLLCLQKRRQTNSEMEKTSIFAGEVVELLRNAPQYSIPFRKFVRSYHYYFGYQCKLSDYGFMRLAELLEALSGVVEMDNTKEESRRIFLSRKVAIRIFSEQIQEIIKSMANGKTNILVRVDELMELHKNKYGYQMHGSSLGYETVIDALKFVPFIELSSYENELWLTSHLTNEKFRQRAMLACLTIIDLGVKVPLAKFQIAFAEKFKFSIHEKTLHAMKHAVEIEIVNGIKMISITPMMKFLIHISNILEQKKSMNVQDIKNLLKLNVTNCFAYGYPNLSSLLIAHPDIFNVIKSGAGVNERCDVELVPDCPLCPSGLQKLLTKNTVQIGDEKPEMFRQAIKHPIGYNRAKVSNLNCSSSSTKYDSDLYQTSFQQPNLQPLMNRTVNYNPFVHDVTMSTTMPMNNLNNVYQPQQPNLQQTPQYFFNQYDEPQSFYERNLKFQQQQQQLHAMKFWNSVNNSSSGFSAAGLNDSNLQQYPMMTPYCRFDPPKPDTPPSKPSIWFDPVWKNDSGMFDINRSNSGGNNDSLKAFNVHVVSPFLSFKTMFTFDNINPASGNSQPKM